jgi:hypothetical protein
MRKTTVIDLTGNRYGRWTVVNRAGTHYHPKRKTATWNVVCDCGIAKVLRGTELTKKTGASKSCGCLQREIAREMGRKQTGINHGNWKGGRLVVKGYVRLAKSLVKQRYPNAVLDEKKHCRGMYEHIAAMSHHLQRALFPGETVHHKDGNKENNDISNLELRVGNHGPGQNIADVVCWAENVLSRYAPEKLR